MYSIALIQTDAADVAWEAARVGQELRDAIAHVETALAILGVLGPDTDWASAGVSALNAKIDELGRRAGAVETDLRARESEAAGFAIS